MKRIRFLLVFIIMTSLFTACSINGTNKPLTTETINSSKPVKYTLSELKDILEFDGSIEELLKNYTVNHIEILANDTRIAFVSDNNIAVLRYDQSGCKLTGGLYGFTNKKSDFEALKQGQSIETVKTLDPQGNYIYLYVSNSDSPKISQHYTKDGYEVTIYYQISLENHYYIIDSVRFKPFELVGN